MLSQRPLLILIVLALSLTNAWGQANPVLTWGGNSFGELGDATTSSKSLPAPAHFLTGIKQVSAGAYHNLVLTSDGRIYTWGNNFNGQLGLGDKTARSTPTLIPGLYSIVAISAGWGHSMALTDQGQVYTWGANGSGALGLGDSVDRTVPTLTLLSQIKEIAAGGSHSLAYSETGDLFSVGYNAYGQLGIGNTTTSYYWTAVTSMARSIRSITAGQYHSTLLLTDGSVYSAGNNSFGQIGDGTLNTRTTFVRSAVSYARSIASGPTAYHTLAIKMNGGVAAWGRNNSGQLGDGTTTNRAWPVGMSNIQNAKAVSTGGAHSLMLMANGTARAVGSNFGGRLGDGTATDRLTPVLVKTSALWSAISAGGGHNIALKCMDVPRSWGRGLEGQLGNGLLTNKTAPVTMTGLTSGVLSAASGQEFTLILKADGTVWATGDNEWGQLGIGSTVNQTKVVKIPTLTNVIAIAAGGFHAFAITADGLVWGWGGNFDGQLGVGDRYNRLSPEVVDWGYVAIAGGKNHSLGLTVEGELYAWGTNEFGQVGSGLDQKVPVPVRVPWSYTYPPVAIAAGGAFNMTLNSDGSLSAWGNNGGGQLATGDFNSRHNPNHQAGTAGVRISAGYMHALHYNSASYLYAAGDNTWGQLGLGSVPYRNTWGYVYAPFAGIAAASSHSAGMDSSGNLYTWGYNASGALGNGTTTNRNLPTFIQAHLYTTGLWTGSSAFHSVALSNRPIMVSSLKLLPASVLGGESTTGTVTLSANAGAGGLAVRIILDSGVASAPSTVYVPAGSRTATFTVTTQRVTAKTTVPVHAHLQVGATAVLTLNP